MLVEWAEAGEPVADDLGRALDNLSAQVDAGETKKMLGGEHDRKNAIITIHPGAGGTESQDWAEMLLRMYIRWTERKGFKRDVMDLQPGDEAGIKSATLTIAGDYAYGMLLAEAGVHRLVRISPYDQASRRHTSFASLYVWPELPDDVDVEVDEKDLRVDTYRSSGAGGQHVNVTDSAIRITHMPTGIVVSCQNERSQHKNRAQAMKVLKARLYDLKMKEQAAKLEQLGGEKKDIAFGSQIRSYVLHPYQMAKDHRTKEEVGNVDRVLDGDIDIFIKTYLMKKASGTLGQPSAAGRRDGDGDPSFTFHRPARLGPCDERLGNRAGSPFRRRGASLVDRHEHDIAGRLELRRFLAFADPRLHHLHPDRQRGFGAGHVAADRALLIEADPDADRDVRIEADEPGIGVVVGRAGLAADRPVQRRRLGSGAALHHAAEQIGDDVGGVGADGVLRLGPILLEHVASPVGDLEHRVRLHVDALIREHRVRAGDLEQRGFGGAERDRQVGRNRGSEPEPSRVGDDLVAPSCSITRTAGTLRDCSSAWRSVTGPSYWWS